MRGVPSDVSTATYRVRVAYVDTDQGQIVHHATYLRYLECARIELMRQRGLTYRDLELDHAFALPVATAHISYKRPARFDDLLEITTWMAIANRAKVRFDSVICKDGEILTHAELTLACIRLPEGRLCSMPERVLSLADAHVRGKR